MKVGKSNEKQSVFLSVSDFKSLPFGRRSNKDLSSLTESKKMLQLPK